MFVHLILFRYLVPPSRARRHRCTSLYHASTGLAVTVAPLCPLPLCHRRCIVIIVPVSPLKTNHLPKTKKSVVYGRIFRIIFVSLKAFFI
jgi:hypothetical protein